MTLFIDKCGRCGKPVTCSSSSLEIRQAVGVDYAVCERCATPEERHKSDMAGLERARTFVQRRSHDLRCL